MQRMDEGDRIVYYTWNNAIRRIAHAISGGSKAYQALSKKSRLAAREMAKRMYSLGTDVPTAAAAEETVTEGFVYVITHPAFPNHVKIGRAFNPKSRTNAYQTGCPFRAYRLYSQCYFTDAHEAEKEIHSRLSSLREQGEWFRMTPLQANQAITQMKQEQRNVG